MDDGNNTIRFTLPDGTAKMCNVVLFDFSRPRRVIYVQISATNVLVGIKETINYIRSRCLRRVCCARGRARIIRINGLRCLVELSEQTRAPGSVTYSEVCC